MLLVYAHRPLDTKFLLILYMAEAVWYFPQAPNGTIMMVELSSEPYCKAYKHEHIQCISLSCKQQVNVSKNFSKGLQSELDFFTLTSLLRIVQKRQQPNKCLSDLLSDDVSCLCWVGTLVDGITDFLVTQQEVDAVCGQSQERVVCMFDLTIGTGTHLKPLQTLFTPSSLAER